jgi:hypothetical protein
VWVVFPSSAPSFLKVWSILTTLLPALLLKTLPLNSRLSVGAGGQPLSTRRYSTQSHSPSSAQSAPPRSQGKGQGKPPSLKPLTKAERASIDFSDEITEVITGDLLGDLTLAFSGKSKDPRLQSTCSFALLQVRYYPTAASGKPTPKLPGRSLIRLLRSSNPLGQTAAGLSKEQKAALSEQLAKNKEVQGVIIGMLLGDACLRIHGNDAHMLFEHQSFSL